MSCSTIAQVDLSVWQLPSETDQQVKKKMCVDIGALAVFLSDLFLCTWTKVFVRTWATISAINFSKYKV